MDAFVKPLDQYQRQTDMVPAYHRAMATFLHKTTGQPLERCYNFVVRETGPRGSMPMRDPTAMVLVRQPNGDRKMEITSMQNFLETIKVEQEVLSPSMTAYVSADKDESILGMYIGDNLKKRSIAKHAMFDAGNAAQVAEKNGDLMLALDKLSERSIYEGLQTSIKINNNSLSGAHVSEHTILFNKTAHSSLTSGCRAAASVGNINNEKFIMGSRHYWSPDAVMANILAICQSADMKALEEVMVNRMIYWPTVDDTMGVIDYSTRLYWRNGESMLRIRELVEGLSPIERAAFVYIGDLYHLAMFNDQLVRDFITKLAIKPSTPHAEPDPVMAKADGDMKAFISVVCAEELDGEKISNIKKVNANSYGLVAAMTQQAMDTVHEYQDMVRALWVTDVMPSDVAYAPSIIRRCAITSDTDSTIFTVQHWTQWYRGQLDFTQTSMAVAASIVYLASQTVRHLLAQVSANEGMARRHLDTIQMKNEYMFPIYFLTGRAKHYFAYISAQEGNVFKKFGVEIKGVALRNSALPANIMKRAKDMMTGIMDEVMAGRKISYAKMVQYVGDVERSIADSVDAGSYEYFQSTSIKSSESYKNADSSNYVHYGLWQEVFAPKYGNTEAPPYVAVKVAVDAENPTKLRAWLAKIEDVALRDRLKAWLDKYNRTNMTMILLPQSVLTTTGIPKEIIQGIDKKNLIGGLTESFYLILESLGLFLRNREMTRLASDTGW
jgi:hypothetical protein